MKRTPLRRHTPLRSRPRRFGGQYAKVRGWIADRSNGRCEARCCIGCNGRGAQAHHVLRRSQGGADDPGNLLWVCAACHDHIHSNPEWSYEAGLLRRRREEVGS